MKIYMFYSQLNWTEVTWRNLTRNLLDLIASSLRPFILNNTQKPWFDNLKHGIRKVWDGLFAMNRIINRDYGAEVSNSGIRDTVYLVSWFISLSVATAAFSILIEIGVQKKSPASSTTFIHHHHRFFMGSIFFTTDHVINDQHHPKDTFIRLVCVSVSSPNWGWGGLQSLWGTRLSSRLRSSPVRPCQKWGLEEVVSTETWVMFLYVFVKIGE